MHKLKEEMDRIDQLKKVSIYIILNGFVSYTWEYTTLAELELEEGHLGNYFHVLWLFLGAPLFWSIC